MSAPSIDEVLASVVRTLEEDIAPAADEHAASRSRTCAQMLRQVRARLREEPAAEAEELADLRALLASLVADEPDETSPVRVAARGYVARQLERRLAWERDAYTGPRR
jgi:hypothetical protein